MELKPCPFCGGSCLDRCDDGVSAWVECNDSECGGRSGEFEVDADSESAWNTRPIEDALLARAEEAEAKLAAIRKECLKAQASSSATYWVWIYAPTLAALLAEEE